MEGWQGTPGVQINLRKCPVRQVNSQQELGSPQGLHRHQVICGNS